MILSCDLQNGNTTYKVHDTRFATPVCCRINTWNEFILWNTISILHKTSETDVAINRVQLSYGEMLSCVVASQHPSNNSACHLVDHKNQVTTDDFAANLHWVTPSFNAFNLTRTPGASGYFGVKAKLVYF